MTDSLEVVTIERDQAREAVQRWADQAVRAQGDLTQRENERRRGRLERLALVASAAHHVLIVSQDDTATSPADELRELYLHARSALYDLETAATRVLAAAKKPSP